MGLQLAGFKFFEEKP